MPTMWRTPSMNKKKLIEKITENWTVKAICLVFAVVIYIFHQVTMLETKSITVPLTVESSGLMIPFSELPKYVKISVRTTAENIPSVYSSGFKACINVDHFTEAGIYQVPVEVLVSENMSLIEPLEYSVKPEVLKVELDEKSVKYVPIEAAISGEVEHGYSVKDISINPSTVKVVGPSKILEKTKSIYTKKIILSGAEKSFSKEVRLDNVNDLIVPYPEGDFKVAITVVPSDSSKEFKSIVPVVKNLNPNLEIITQIPAISLQLDGALLVLENYNLLPEDVFVNLKDIDKPGTYEIPVDVTVPTNLVLAKKSLDKVTLTVSQKVLEEEDELQDEHKTLSDKKNDEEDESKKIDSSKNSTENAEQLPNNVELQNSGIEGV